MLLLRYTEREREREGVGGFSSSYLLFLEPSVVE